MDSQIHQEHQIHQLTLGRAIDNTPRKEDSKKRHDVYWVGSNWHCRNCKKYGDKFYMTQETWCNGGSNK